MAQHDYNLANQSGLAFRSDLNDLAAAIVSQNSGATAPATTFAFMWWADTSTGKLKIRNAANSAWIDVGTLASANLGLAIAGAITASGLTQSTAKLLGRTTAGTGAPEEIGVSEGVQLVSGALKADVNGLTEDTTPDTANDFALVWDASASAHKKVKLNKFSGGGITLGTPVNSTSGTSIDFTSLPAGLKRITIMLDGVSTNGPDPLCVQIGKSGGVETTGYVGAYFNSSGLTTNNISSSFVVGALGAANNANGSIVLSLLDSSTNTWAAAINVGLNTTAVYFASGSKSLAGVLDRVRITTTGGANAFDAGKINIAYE